MVNLNTDNKSITVSSKTRATTKLDKRNPLIVWIDPSMILPGVCMCITSQIHFIALLSIAVSLTEAISDLITFVPRMNQNYF